MDDKQKMVLQYQKSIKKHVTKQKLRDARRKSDPKEKEKKPRQKDWISEAGNDWDEIDNFAEERVMPRGSTERRREVQKLAQKGAPRQKSELVIGPIETESSLGVNHELSGLVVEASSGMCRVNLNDHTILCHLRGNLKSVDSGYTNSIAVGDRVVISQDGDQPGVVEKVLPRRNVLARPFSPDKGKSSGLQQIVVANIDRVLIVASWREPNIWPELLDRYLITALRNDLEAVICINKVDLVQNQDEFQSTLDAYRGLGHEILLTSAANGQGIDTLRLLLQTGTTVLAGLSGVGKSSLLVAVQPELKLRTAHVSQRGSFTGQGRHTTTQSSLWRLENGGVVIDTPGIRDFGLAGVLRSQLASWYPEMTPLIGHCRYSDCVHINEPGCAIKQAIDDNDISPLRYKNYTQIFDCLKE